MNLSQDIISSMKEQMNKPEGSIVFDFFHHELTNEFTKGGTIFEIVTGKQAFILERTDDLIFNYYYSTPGSGTSIASIDFKSLPKFSRVFICLTWSSEKITLSIGPKETSHNQLITVEGERAQTQIQVGENEKIYFIGDENLEIGDIFIFEGEKEILSSTAINSWNNIKEGINVIGTGRSDLGYMYESVVTNLSISIMVTGLESYLKKRFLELEKEGIIPNKGELLNLILTKKEKEDNHAETLVIDAKNEGISLLKYLVKKKED